MGHIYCSGLQAKNYDTQMQHDTNYTTNTLSIKNRKKTNKQTHIHTHAHTHTHTHNNNTMGS